MALIHIPCLVEKPTKTGPNYYWQPSAALKRAKWPPVALGKDKRAAHDAAEAINAEVERWRAGGEVDAVPTRPKPDTLAELIARYRAEHLNGTRIGGAPCVKPATRDNANAPLDRLSAWAGKQPLDWITRDRIKDFCKAELPRIGHAPTWLMLKTLRALFTFADDAGMKLPNGNPARGVKLPKPKSRRAVWEIEDEAAFKAAAIDLGLPGMALAMDLAIYTGQRAGDLIAMTEAQLVPIILHSADRDYFAGPAGDVLGWCFDQEKLTDDDEVVHMQIPIEPALRARIDAALRTNRARDRASNYAHRLISYVLVDDHTGKPWSQRQFHRHWTQIKRHAAKAAGRPQVLKLVWHDLRRTRVVRMRRQGLAPVMIATLTGHSPAAIAEMLRVYAPVDPTMTAAAIRAAA